VEVGIRFVEAASLKGAKTPALFCDAAIIDNEAGNPGPNRH
jgi:hypothetical protein